MFADVGIPADLNKSFNPTFIVAGDISRLRVSIYNSNFYDLVLSTVPAAWSDSLPAGVTIANPADPTTTCGGTISIIGQTISLIGGRVPAKTGDTVGECHVEVNVTSVVPGNHDNVIPANNLVATDPSGTIQITNSTPATQTLQVDSLVAPSVTKAFNPNIQWVGLTSQLTIAVRNNDLTYPLTDVTLTDGLPENITIANTTISFTNCGTGAEIVGPGGIPLAAGQTSFTLRKATIPKNSVCTARVNVVSTVPNVYVNTIQANAVQTRQAVTNTLAASAPINFQAIGMTKSFSPGTIQAGRTSTMTITLQNPSASPYTGVGFTDNLPAGVTVASPPTESQCGGTVTYTENSITLSGGTVPSGSPNTCTITALVTAAISGSYTNTIYAGELDTDQGATNVADVTANLGVYSPGAGVTGSKSFNPSTIAVNGISQMSINIRAPADTSLTNFSLTDALPAGVRVASTPAASKNVNCSGGTWNPGSGDTLLTYSGGTIPAGQQCTLRVNVTSSNTGTYTNVISPANISNTEKRNISSNISATLRVSGISVSKSFYPSTVNLNGISTLTIILTNINTEQLNDVAFIDNLAQLSSGLIIADEPNASTTCVDGLVSAPINGTVLSMTGGKIPAQVGNVPGICTVNVDVKGTTTGTKTNRINANAVSGKLAQSNITITNPVLTQAELLVENIIIQVVKDLQPRTVFGGAASTMTIRLTNPNNTVLTNISFTDNLPESTDPLNPGRMSVATPAQASTGTCGGAISVASGAESFTFSGGTLDPNESCILSIKVTQNAGGNLTNTIPAGGIRTDNGATNPQSASATLTNQPGVSITKYFTINPVPSGTGNLTTLSLKLENTGNVNLTGLTFTDVFDGLSVAVAPDPNQCNGIVSTTANSITLTGGALLGKTSCTILVDLVAVAPGIYQNCIAAEALTSDQRATNDETCDTLVVEESLLPPAISKAFSPNPVALASTSALTFTITNPNNVPLSGVAFSDTFPAGLTRASVPNVSQCGGTVSSTSDSVSLSNGSIAANASCTVIISVRGAAGGDYPNTSSTVTSSNGGTGNEASATLQVVAPPVIAKSFNPNPITAGGSSMLTFTISNPPSNTLALSNVSFTDVFPNGIVKSAEPITPQCGGVVTSAVNSVTLTNGSIAIGESCTLTIEVSAANAGTYTNTSNPVTSGNGGTGNSAVDTLTVNGVGLALVKTSSASNYKNIGEIVNYSYTLINTGDAILYAPFSIIDDRVAGPFDCGGAIEIPVGSQIECTAPYTVTEADYNAKSITNIAAAIAKDESSNDVTSPSSTVTIRLAALTLDKSTTTLSFRSVGNSITYNYTLTNTGRVTLFSPFSVIDDHFGTPLACGSSTSLAPGGVLSCNRTYTVKQEDVDAGLTTNIAVATAQDASTGGSMVTSNSDSVTVYRVIAPILSKTFSPTVIPVGGTSTLRLTINNPNPVTLTGVSVIDNLPANISLTIAPSSSQCGGSVSYDAANNRISLTNGSIIPNGSCDITAQVTSIVPGDHLNTTGNVNSSNGGAGNSAQATLKVLTPPLISKSFSPSSILLGETSIMTFSVTNPTENTTAITGVEFDDDLPLGITITFDNLLEITTQGCQGEYSMKFEGENRFSVRGITIPAGGNCVIRVPVTSTDTGVFPNSTSAIRSLESGAGVPSNTATLNVSAAADLSITKDDRKLAVEPGEEVTYQLVATNNGPSNATGAQVFDSFPSTLENISWVCTPDIGATCTPNGSGNISDIVNLPTGLSITYTITASVKHDTQTSVINSASIIPPAGLLDPDNSNNIQVDNDKINILDIEKTVVETSFNTFGQVLHYIYTVTNKGTSTLSAPFDLTDDLADVECEFPESLLPDEQFSCSGTYTVAWEDLDNGSITNQASATAKDADGDTVRSNTAEVTIYASQEPLIGIAKRTDRVAKVSAGTYDVTFEILVKNYGNVTLADVLAADDLTDTFPLPTTFSIQSINSDDLVVNPAFDGKTDIQLLDLENSLAPEEEKTLTLVVRVVPASGGPFNNSATAGATHPVVGLVSDISQSGDDPDPDEDKDPTNNNEPTPVDFGPELFDPPMGVKRFNVQNRPVIEWTMVWINDTNIANVYGYVQDPIPANTTFYNNGIDSGYPVPDGAPRGSISEGVSCTHSAISTTTLCYYEGPTLDHPLGQIIWEGTVGPDFGVSDPNRAANAVNISFNVLLDSGGVTRIRNIATINSDRNGDGDADDAGESVTATASQIWDVTPLPATGFAPGVVTKLPEQPEALAYKQTDDLFIEIPTIGVRLPIVGVSQSTGGWDLTWLGDQAGWLEGTAFPSWAGNSAITAHVLDSNGQPGPFADLHNLKWGDEVVIEAWGQRYVYEIREIDEWVSPEKTDFLTHEDFPWLTLITCKNYNPQTGSYDWRVLVRAVQVRVE